MNLETLPCRGCFIVTARKRSLGQGNIFTPVCHSVHRGGRAWFLRGGMCGCSGGHGMVAPRGMRVAPGVGGMRGCSGGRGHVWLIRGGMRGFSWGGMRGCSRGGMCGCSGGHAWFYLGGIHGFIWGACMVLFGGMHGFIWGGHAWFYLGAWFYSGGHAWFYSGGMCGFIWGGAAWFFQFFRIQWDRVNERTVCILLECILVCFVLAFLRIFTGTVPTSISAETDYLSVYRHNL